MTVAASSPTATIPAVSDGIHDLLVVAVDAAGAESASTIFSWVVGDGQQPLTSDPAASGPALATLTTTETIETTNDDGTTTTTTSTDAASTPAQDTSAPFAGQTASQLGTGGSFAATPQNLPGGGGGRTYGQLSCAKERVIWTHSPYAQLAVRYNCHYGRGTVNWDQRLAPELPGRFVPKVDEEGMIWARTGVLGTITNQKNAPHPNEPLDYVFHGSVDTPARVGDLVTGTDFFAYTWWTAKQHGTVRIILGWGCNLVP